MAGGISRTGTSAMMVLAIPVVVYLTAMREKDTPRKGPKKDPEVTKASVDGRLKAGFRSDHLFRMVNNRMKPMVPATTLICEEVKGSASCIPYLLKTSPIACPAAAPKPNKIPLGE